MFQIGDFVAALNEPLSGQVIGFDNRKIIVLTQEGFEIAFEAKFLVKHQPDWFDNIKVPNKDKTSTLQKTKISSIKKEVDLHLKDKNITTDKILSEQLHLFKTQLNAGIKHKLPQMIFIHGYGEGVLKTAILEILQKNKIQFSDAPYTHYGMGAAIQVELKGVTKKVV